MFEDGEPVRWIGLLVAGGTLLPLFAWLALDVAPERVRAVATVAATFVLFTLAGGALQRAAWVAGSFGSPDGGPFFEDEVGLGKPLAAALAGVAAGLLLALLVPSYETEPDIEADEDDAEPVAEPLHGATEVIGDDPADTWSARVVTGAAEAPVPGLRLPWSPETGALLALAVGTAVPMVVFAGDFQVIQAARNGDSVGWIGWLAIAAGGLMPGLALLAGALPLRLRSAFAVVLAYAILAAGAGVEMAWPDTFDGPVWTAFATGLGVAAILPITLRLMQPWLAEHRRTVGAGLLVALSLYGGFYALTQHAVRRVLEAQFL